MSTTETPKEFWDWFHSNAPHFPQTKDFDAEYGDQLSKNLSDVAEGLTYEISISDSKENELVISADGISDLIPSVKTLVESAPSIPGWAITAFRPRMSDYTSFSLDYGHQIFDPTKLWCYSRVQDGQFDLIIYHPDYSDENRDLLVSGFYILLDMALGEFDVMTGIRYIDHQLLPPDPEKTGLYKFERLRSVYDSHKASLPPNE